MSRSGPLNSTLFTASANQAAHRRGHLRIEKLTADDLIRSHQLRRLSSSVFVGHGRRSMAADNVVDLLLDRADPSGFLPGMAQLMEDLVDLLAVEKAAEPLRCLVADLEVPLCRPRCIEHIRADWDPGDVLDQK